MKTNVGVTFCRTVTQTLNAVITVENTDGMKDQDIITKAIEQAQKEIKPEYFNAKARSGKGPITITHAAVVNLKKLQRPKF